MAKAKAEERLKALVSDLEAIFEAERDPVAQRAQLRARLAEEHGEEAAPEPSES